MERGKRNKMLYLILILGAVAYYAVASKQLVFGSKLTPELEMMIEMKAKKWGLEPALVKAVAKVESGFNTRAKNPADPSYGLMQITPGLAYDYGLILHYKNLSREEINKIYNVQNNLDVGCQFMKKLHSRYTFDVAVQMYNTGEKGYESGVRATYYLKRVKGFYHEYSKGI